MNNRSVNRPTSRDLDRSDAAARTRAHSPFLAPEIGSAPRWPHQSRPSTKNSSPSSRGGNNGAGTSTPTQSEQGWPERAFLVSKWFDPVVERLGFDARSSYVETFWLPVVGPSSIMLIRNLAGSLEQNPSGAELETTQLARELGLGIRPGKNGYFWRAVQRCERFGLMRRNGQAVLVRTMIPPLSHKQLERLPPGLSSRHQSALDQRDATSR